MRLCAAIFAFRFQNSTQRTHSARAFIRPCVCSVGSSGGKYRGIAGCRWSTVEAQEDCESEQIGFVGATRVLRSPVSQCDGRSSCGPRAMTSLFGRVRISGQPAASESHNDNGVQNNRYDGHAE